MEERPPRARELDTVECAVHQHWPGQLPLAEGRAECGGGGAWAVRGELLVLHGALADGAGACERRACDHRSRGSDKQGALDSTTRYGVLY